jgi:hypothetical protein
MKIAPDLATTVDGTKAEDPWSEQIVRIMRRRECVYRLFVCSCAVACLLLVLLWWFKLGG